MAMPSLGRVRGAIYVHLVLISTYFDPLACCENTKDDEKQKVANVENVSPGYVTLGCINLEKTLGSIGKEGPKKIN